MRAACGRERSERTRDCELELPCWRAGRRRGRAAQRDVEGYPEERGGVAGCGLGAAGCGALAGCRAKNKQNFRMSYYSDGQI